MSREIRSLEDRKKIEEAWNSGASAKEIADIMGVASLNNVYVELRRGRDGTCTKDGRKKYSAELAFERNKAAREQQWLQAKRTGYRSLENRKEIQRAYELGATADQLTLVMSVTSVSTVYTELRHGYDGTFLPDGRRRYDAELAHKKYMDSLIRRGGAGKSRREKAETT